MGFIKNVFQTTENLIGSVAPKTKDLAGKAMGVAETLAKKAAEHPKKTLLGFLGGTLGIAALGITKPEYEEQDEESQKAREEAVKSFLESAPKQSVVIETPMGFVEKKITGEYDDTEEQYKRNLLSLTATYQTRFNKNWDFILKGLNLTEEQKTRAEEQKNKIDQLMTKPLINAYSPQATNQERDIFYSLYLTFDEIVNKNAFNHFRWIGDPGILGEYANVLELMYQSAEEVLREQKGKTTNTETLARKISEKIKERTQEFSAYRDEELDTLELAAKVKNSENTFLKLFYTPTLVAQHIGLRLNKGTKQLDEVLPSFYSNRFSNEFLKNVEALSIKEKGITEKAKLLTKNILRNITQDIDDVALFGASIFVGGAAGKAAKTIATGGAELTKIQALKGAIVSNVVSGLIVNSTINKSSGQDLDGTLFLTDTAIDLAAGVTEAGIEVGRRLKQTADMIDKLRADLFSGAESITSSTFKEKYLKTFGIDVEGILKYLPENLSDEGQKKFLFDEGMKHFMKNISSEPNVLNTLLLGKFATSIESLSQKDDGKEIIRKLLVGIKDGIEQIEVEKGIDEAKKALLNQIETTFNEIGGYIEDFQYIRVPELADKELRFLLETFYKKLGGKATYDYISGIYNSERITEKVDGIVNSVFEALKTDGKMNEKAVQAMNYLRGAVGGEIRKYLGYVDNSDVQITFLGRLYNNLSEIGQQVRGTGRKEKFFKKLLSDVLIRIEEFLLETPFKVDTQKSVDVHASAIMSATEDFWAVMQKVGDKDIDFLSGLTEEEFKKFKKENRKLYSAISNVNAKLLNFLVRKTETKKEVLEKIFSGQGIKKKDILFPAMFLKKNGKPMEENAFEIVLRMFYKDDYSIEKLNNIKQPGSTTTGQEELDEIRTVVEYVQELGRENNVNLDRFIEEYLAEKLKEKGKFSENIFEENILEKEKEIEIKKEKGEEKEKEIEIEKEKIEEKEIEKEKEKIEDLEKEKIEKEKETKIEEVKSLGKTEMEKQQLAQEEIRQEDIKETGETELKTEEQKEEVETKEETREEKKEDTKEETREGTKEEAKGETGETTDEGAEKEKRKPLTKEEIEQEWINEILKTKEEDLRRMAPPELFEEIDEGLQGWRASAENFEEARRRATFNGHVLQDLVGGVSTMHRNRFNITTLFTSGATHHFTNETEVGPLYEYAKNIIQTAKILTQGVKIKKVDINDIGAEFLRKIVDIKSGESSLDISQEDLYAISIIEKSAKEIPATHLKYLEKMTQKNPKMFGQAFGDDVTLSEIKTTINFIKNVKSFLVFNAMRDAFIEINEKGFVTFKTPEGKDLLQELNTFGRYIPELPVSNVGYAADVFDVSIIAAKHYANDRKFIDMFLDFLLEKIGKYVAEGNENMMMYLEVVAPTFLQSLQTAGAKGIKRDLRELHRLAVDAVEEYTKPLSNLLKKLIQKDGQINERTATELANIFSMNLSEIPLQDYKEIFTNRIEMYKADLLWRFTLNYPALYSKYLTLKQMYGEPTDPQKIVNTLVFSHVLARQLQIERTNQIGALRYILQKHGLHYEGIYDAFSRIEKKKEQIRRATYNNIKHNLNLLNKYEPIIWKQPEVFVNNIFYDLLKLEFPAQLLKFLEDRAKLAVGERGKYVYEKTKQHGLYLLYDIYKKITGETETNFNAFLAKADLVSQATEITQTYYVQTQKNKPDIVDSFFAKELYENIPEVTLEMQKKVEDAALMAQEAVEEIHAANIEAAVQEAIEGAAIKQEPEITGVEIRGVDAGDVLQATPETAPTKTQERRERLYVADDGTVYMDAGKTTTEIIEDIYESLLNSLDKKAMSAETRREMDFAGNRIIREARKGFLKTLRIISDEIQEGAGIVNMLDNKLLTETKNTQIEKLKDIIREYELEGVKNVGGIIRYITPIMYRIYKTKPGQRLINDLEYVISEVGKYKGVLLPKIAESLASLGFGKIETVVVDGVEKTKYTVDDIDFYVGERYTIREIDSLITAFINRKRFGGLGGYQINTSRWEKIKQIIADIEDKRKIAGETKDEKIADLIHYYYYNYIPTILAENNFFRSLAKQKKTTMTNIIEEYKQRIQENIKSGDFVFKNYLRNGFLNFGMLITKEQKDEFLKAYKETYKDYGDILATKYATEDLNLVLYRYNVFYDTLWANINLFRTAMFSILFNITQLPKITQQYIANVLKAKIFFSGTQDLPKEVMDLLTENQKRNGLGFDYMVNEIKEYEVLEEKAKRPYKKILGLLGKVSINGLLLSDIFMYKHLNLGEKSIALGAKLLDLPVEYFEYAADTIVRFKKNIGTIEKELDEVAKNEEIIRRMRLLKTEGMIEKYKTNVGFIKNSLETLGTIGKTRLSMFSLLRGFVETTESKYFSDKEELLRAIYETEDFLNKSYNSFVKNLHSLIIASNFLAAQFFHASSKNEYILSHVSASKIWQAALPLFNWSIKESGYHLTELATLIKKINSIDAPVKQKIFMLVDSEQFNAFVGYVTQFTVLRWRLNKIINAVNGDDDNNIDYKELLFAISSPFAAAGLIFAPVAKSLEYAIGLNKYGASTDKVIGAFINNLFGGLTSSFFKEITYILSAFTQSYMTYSELKNRHIDAAYSEILFQTLQKRFSYSLARGFSVFVKGYEAQPKPLDENTFIELLVNEGVAKRTKEAEKIKNSLYALSQAGAPGFFRNEFLSTMWLKDYGIVAKKMIENLEKTGIYSLINFDENTNKMLNDIMEKKKGKVYDTMLEILKNDDFLNALSQKKSIKEKREIEAQIESLCKEGCDLQKAMETIGKLNYEYSASYALGVLIQEMAKKATKDKTLTDEEKAEIKDQIAASFYKVALSFNRKLGPKMALVYEGVVNNRDYGTGYLETILLFNFYKQGLKEGGIPAAVENVENLFSILLHSQKNKIAGMYADENIFNNILNSIEKSIDKYAKSYIDKEYMKAGILLATGNAVSKLLNAKGGEKYIPAAKLLLHDILNNSQTIINFTEVQAPTEEQEEKAKTSIKAPKISLPSIRTGGYKGVRASFQRGGVNLLKAIPTDKINFASGGRALTGGIETAQLLKREKLDLGTTGLKQPKIEARAPLKAGEYVLVKDTSIIDRQLMYFKAAATKNKVVIKLLKLYDKLALGINAKEIKLGRWNIYKSLMQGKIKRLDVERYIDYIIKTNEEQKTINIKEKQNERTEGKNIEVYTGKPTVIKREIKRAPNVGGLYKSYTRKIG